MSGFGAVPQPRRSGSKRARALKGSGSLRGVSEESVQTTPR